jgi:hypothetical protein
MKVNSAITFSILFASGELIFAQGSLTPGGAPAPDDEVVPRLTKALFTIY